MQQCRTNPVLRLQECERRRRNEIYGQKQWKTIPVSLSKDTKVFEQVAAINQSNCHLLRQSGTTQSTKCQASHLVWDSVCAINELAKEETISEHRVDKGTKKPTNYRQVSRVQNFFAEWQKGAVEKAMKIGRKT
ncbi:hypothetical protein JTB14_014229 [Gonioctena quinquepunctata]|nr:hypothetical protein JTB14_014229 [Gonioctena quinquepunctata]